ncbi:MAG: terminase, partial [Phenylobacterium sp.]|nr:terminase [Phenylobacterium sp.]
WTVINLPAVADDDECWPYETFLGQHVWRRQKGDLLHPERFSVAELDELRLEIGEAAWWSQFQQQPTPAGGGLVKREWFRQLPADSTPRRYDQVVQSWDTATKIAEWNDYSVCVTFGLLGEEIHILDVFRERLIYPELRDAVIQHARRHRANTVLIEDKNSGSQLLQELPQIGFYNAKGILPSGNKQMRMASQSGIIQHGRVFIPNEALWHNEASWVRDYLHELVMFPNGRFFDQVDATSQGLAYLNTFSDPAWALKEATRRRVEDQGQGGASSWVMKPPPAWESSVLGMDGHPVVVHPDGYARVDADTGPVLARLGWTRSASSGG